MTTTTKVALTLAALSGCILPSPGLQAQSPTPGEGPLSARDGRMVVPVNTADGAELTFLVSTGSAVTVFSETGQQRIGDQAVTLGGLPVNMEGSQTVPDADLTVDGVVMDGLVSNNTLNEYDVLFDVPGGRLVLKPFGRSVEWPGMTLSDPTRLRIYHGVVIGLDVEVNGTEYPAMLELGAPALLVNQAVLQESGIAGETADLRLASSDFNGVPIRLSDHPVIDRFSPNGDGFVLVGTPPALDCAIAVSWVHRELRTCVR
jgi:hypothetical protein